MTEAARDRLALIRLKAAAIIPAYGEEKHIGDVVRRTRQQLDHVLVVDDGSNDQTAVRAREAGAEVIVHPRSEEHTSELQSRPHLVCRLLLVKKELGRHE